MGHIPYPTPRGVSDYEQRELREGDIVRIEYPERMPENVPEQLIGKPLKVKNINYEESKITIKYNSTDVTLPIKKVTMSTRTTKEFIKDIIEYFRE